MPFISCVRKSAHQIPRYARRTSSLPASSSAEPGRDDRARSRARSRVPRCSSARPAFCSTTSIESPSLAVELAERAEQLLGDERREPERRLVEQHELRARHQRPRDREHLLLAAAHAARLLVAPLAEARERRRTSGRCRRRPRGRGGGTRRRAGCRRPSGRRSCPGPAARARCPPAAICSVRRPTIDVPVEHDAPVTRRSSPRSRAASWSCRRRWRRG